MEDAAAIAVPDEARGEEVKAYLVLKPGLTKATLRPAHILEQLAKVLAPFKLPRYLEYVATLPKTPSEKIKKDALKALKPDLRTDSWDEVEKRWR